MTLCVNSNEEHTSYDLGSFSDIDKDHEETYNKNRERTHG